MTATRPRVPPDVLARRTLDPGGTTDGLRAFRPGAGRCRHPGRKSRGGKAGSAGDAAGRSRRDRPGAPAATPSNCWKPKPRHGFRSWCRSGTAGCWPPRSPSTAVRRLIMAADLGSTPHSGLDGAAVRGRAPEQLRRLRHTGTPSGLRHQRLRRDLPRPVRVGRQTAGRQRRGGRADRRLPAEEGKGGRAGGGGRLPGGDPPAGPDGQPRRLVLPPGHGRPAAGDPQAGRRRGRAEARAPAWPRPDSGTATTRCASSASPSTVRCRSRTTRR